MPPNPKITPVMRDCAICGKHMRVVGRRIKTQKFCSHKCYGVGKIGTAHNYKHGLTVGGKSRAWRVINQNARKTRVAMNGGEFTAKEFDDMKNKTGRMCLSCRRPESVAKLTIDHIIPISMGGANSAENIQPLCGSCNSKKFKRTINYSDGYEVTNHADVPKEFMRVNHYKVLAAIASSDGALNIPGIRQFSRKV